MKLFVDDLNHEAPAGWTHAYTAQQAIAVLQTGVVDEMSIDPDLGNGPGVGTGAEVLRWVESRVVSDPQFKIPKIKMHSESPKVCLDIVDRIRAARK